MSGEPLSSRPFDIAAELCELTGSPDLIQYLGLQGNVSSEDAKAELKKRRKYMQGMQSNPKYKEEAMLLIKNFGVLEQAFDNLPEYLADARRRKESEHIPILEMTIKGVLTGGNFSPEQEAYLSRNATELGVTRETFEEILDRLCKEAGVRRPSKRNAPRPDQNEDEITDHYRILGVSPHATADEVRSAFQAQQAALSGTPDAAQPRQAVDKAWSILQDAEKRRQYDLARRRTGPPARSRDDHASPSGGGQSQTNTAPPVRPRGGPSSSMPAKDVGSAPTRPLPVGALARGILPPNRSNPPATVVPAANPRLEIIGDPIRTIRSSRPTNIEVTVRNAGTGPMPGRILVDRDWMVASPTSLDPDAPEQVVTIKVLPNQSSERQSTATVSIVTDHGDRSKIVVELVRTSRVMAGLMIGLLLVVAVLAAAIIAQLLVIVTDPSGKSGSLTVTIEPMAQEVLLDGRPVGSGSTVVVDKPPAGDVVLTVSHPNFKTETKTLKLEAGRSLAVHIALELSRAALEFRPKPEMTKVTLDQTMAQKVMTPRSKAMEACMAATGKPMKGSVRIHVGPSGEAVGVEITGDALQDAGTRACLERQAAAVVFSPLSGGEYATVRYDYEVTPGSTP